jgi:hypothetical protein
MVGTRDGDVHDRVDAGGFEDLRDAGAHREVGETTVREDFPGEREVEIHHSDQFDIGILVQGIKPGGAHAADADKDYAERLGEVCVCGECRP